MKQWFKLVMVSVGMVIMGVAIGIGWAYLFQSQIIIPLSIMSSIIVVLIGWKLCKIITIVE